MKKWTRALALLMALCMLLALAACSKDDGGSTNAGDGQTTTGGDNASTGGNAGGDAAPAGDLDTTVAIGTSASFGYLNPNGGTGMGDNYVTYMVFNQLFDIDKETGKWYSPVSDDWGWDDDTTLHVTIKDGITFDGGAVMDANDVLATCQYNIEFGNQRQGQWAGVIDWDNTTVSDDGKTITFKYFKPYGAALSELCICIADDEFLAAHPDGDEIWWKAPNGSGPYRVKECVADSYVTYELRDDYWDTSRTFDCTEITVKYYSDANSMWAEYQNGVIDAVLGMNDTQVTAVENDPSLGTLVLQSTNCVPCMSMNEHNQYIADERVREAISYAVPWFEVGQIAWGSLAVEATSHFTPTMAAYSDHSGAYTYDPDKARQILADAGYADGEIQLLYVAVNDTQQVRVMEAVQGYLADVGIVITPETYELGTALPEYYFQGKNDMAIIMPNGANATREPWQFLSPLTNGLFLDRSMSDPEYVALADESNATSDYDARMETFKKIDSWLYDNYWMFPYCEVMEAWCFNSRIAEFDMLNNWYDCLGNIKLAK